MPKQRESENKAYLAEIMRAHPTADLKAIRRVAFNNLSRGPNADLKRWCDTTTDRVYKSIIAEPQPVSEEQQEADRAEAERTAKDRLSALSHTILMNLPTPFGKPLGELTGREGRKLVGWQSQAFKGVGDTKRLRDVKSEIELRKIWACVKR